MKLFLAMGLLAIASYAQTGSSSNTAQFVKADTTTQGSWKGAYGGDGYNVFEDTATYPNYVTVTPSGQSNYIWNSSTSDVRAMQMAASPTGRIAATWYTSGSFSLDVNFSDTATHQLAIYCLDWGEAGGVRAETITVLDAVTNGVLDSRNVASFVNGEYLVWNVSGHVVINITNTGSPNAVISGLFFDVAGALTPPWFSPLPGAYPSAQSVSLTTMTGVSIRYTTDGTTPSETSGALYSGPITVSATTTIKAIAYATGSNDSPVKSATYTINAPPAPWTDQDIGAVGVAGAAAFDPTSASFTVRGSGNEVYYAPDQFHYLYQPLAGDGVIVARVVSEQNTYQNTKAGLMIRRSLDPSSAFAYVSLAPDSGGVYFSARAASAGPDFHGVFSAAAPVWVKLIRQGETFSGFYSSDGNTWTSAGSPYAISMGSNVLIGMAVVSTNNGVLTTAVFDNVTIVSGIAVSVSPTSATLSAGQNQQFTATVTNTSNTAATWSVSPNTGSISSAGLYTAPSSITSQQTVTVTATSAADSTKFGAATIALTPATVATPGFSPAAGVYTSAQTVSIRTTTSGASIRYTTDGSTPSETVGTLYSGAITVSSTTTIKAIAYVSEMTDSAVASAAYTINTGSSSNSAQYVKADSTTYGSWKGLYGSGGYNVVDDTTAYPSYVTVTPSGQSDFVWSSSLSQPRALQKAGSASDRIAATWYSGGSFSLDVNFSDAAIHQVTMYFLDWDGGRTQTVTVLDAATNNVLDTRNLTSFYSGEYLVWNLTGHVTIRFTQTGAWNAVVSGLFFDPQAPVATPAFSPIPGTYIPAQTVSISTVTSGASIRYTTDGSTPSETVGALYSAPITVSSTATIKAIAYASGMPDSAVDTATYTITGSGWYDTSWSDRKSITIDHTKVSGSSNLTNFPVLVSLTDANLATVANGGNAGLPDGTDILFTASDGVTKLAHEIESYNASTGQLTAWVNVPTVSPGGDTVIYLYYGNDAATDQQNKTAVWDSNFQEVLHLDESSSTTVLDSTSNGNNGSKVSASSPAATSAGQVAGAQSFNGTSDYVVLPPSMTNGVSVFSVSFWTRTTDTGSDGTYWHQPQFVGDASNGNNSGDFGIVTNNGDLGIWSGLNSGGDSALVTSSVIRDNNWHHIAALNDGSIIRLYLDGQDTGQSLASGLGLDSLGWYLGAQHYLSGNNANFYHQGSIDEFRFSNSARSAGWVGTEYNNESSPSTFYSVGSQEGSGAPPRVVRPTFSPGAGTYTSAQTVSISTTTSGASIRYTTDGSTPSETVGALYSAPITVSSTATVKAIAYASGMSDSSVASAIYTIGTTVATPTFSPGAGTYTTAQTVTISTTTSGASIRYTTDGSTPSETAGTLYSGAITVGSTTTIKAIAYASGMTDSSIASAMYTIGTAVVTPTFSPAAGMFASAQTVTISTATSGTSIRYTTDGSTPSETAGTLYSAPVTVGATTTIKAIAYASGMTDSAVGTATYTIGTVASTPLFSPSAGSYASGQSVTIHTSTSGASIRYTTDGSTPSSIVGTLYGGPITISSTTTLNAIAYAT